jgi:hypothetical protein
MNRMTMSSCRALAHAALVAVILASAGEAGAQTSTAALRGHVFNEQGAPLAGAQVALQDPASGMRRGASTNESGFYNIAAVPPGTYTVEVRRIGFAPQQRTVRLQIGEVITLDMRMTEAAVQLAAMVIVGEVGRDVRSPEVATNITPAQIENLPQGSRNFLDFATLAPGVQRRGAGVSAGGTSESNTNLFIDGASYKSDVLPGGVAGQDPSAARNIGGVGVVVGNPFPQNAVREFRVITQNYKAEYQKATGAVITAATKRGSNTFSGDIFSSGQTDGLIARNRWQLANDREVPFYQRAQFGGSLGGPIVRDRTHFFASYEGNIQQLEQRVDFSDIPAGLPTLPDSLLRGAGLYRAPLRSHLFFGKVTHQLNERQDLMFTVNVRNEKDQRDFGGRSGEETRTLVDNNVATLVGRHTLAADAFTNEAQISAQRFTWAAEPAQAGDARYEYQDWGVVRGANPNFQNFVQDRVSLRNDVTFLASAHVVKIGANLDFLRYDVYKRLEETPIFRFHPSRPGSFNSPFEAQLQIGDPDLVTDNQQVGLYIQDDWAVSEQLSLNLGLRWDYEHNWLNNDFVTPQWVRDSVARFTTEFPYFNVDDYTTDGSARPRFFGAVQPRLGFSYDITNDARTVVFGGAGLFYDRVNYNTLLDESYKAQRPRYTFRFHPSDQAGNPGEIPFDPSYYDRANLVQLIEQGTAGNPEVFLMSNSQKPPRSIHGSLGVRRAFGAYTVSATGTMVNSSNYFKWIWGHRNPANDELQWGRVNELGMGNIIISSDAGKSWYRGLLLQLSRPMVDGARWGGDLSYTLAKTEVNTYNDVEDNFALDYIPGDELFGFERKVPGRFDERHRIVANVTTLLPFDVRFSTITTLGSGYPYTLSTGCQGPWDFDDPNGFCAQQGFDRPAEFIPGFMANPPGLGPRSERPEGSWFGPFGKWAYRNVDARLGKDVSFGRQTIGISLDVLNVFNFQDYNFENFEYNLRWDTNQGAGPFNPRHRRDEFGTFGSRRAQLGVRYSF